jgi:hypothetical protein
MREGKGCGGISFSASTTALNPTNAEIIVSWDGIDIFPLSRNNQGQDMVCCIVRSVEGCVE